MSSISVQISMWRARNDERTVRYQSRCRFLIDVGGRGIALAIPVSVCEAHVRTISLGQVDQWELGYGRGTGHSSVA
ncbi:uncharacterized protein STEHIDRAFT_164176 [Stereum hirsutum FP-91666 SS1]|uniref:Uncharacterized protein n=1 Tax=Stereum hirsutum (strain FP-91666) TaxID=721885 RepID=R7RVF1_STEHR|nr:uncharacterized protein STEHIDRAFT_164176 [Stereum hirsutum FP-91666 SS1]EIM78944.1 hypothetical protein STEHIDRAFT_164176 [Stereum hirsutum FP-91666 SS1]